MINGVESWGTKDALANETEWLSTESTFLVD